MGVGDTFHPTPVGVFFGGVAGTRRGETVADPYFGGAGPDRTPCIGCGECMTGCRHNAKNTLVKNYLYLAEQHGARVHPLTTVTRVRPLRGRRLRRRRPLDQGQAVAQDRDQDVHRRARRLRGRLARHPEAAAPAEGRGRPARAVRPAGPPHPHQLRVDPRRDRARPGDRLQPGRRDHLVVPPRRAHPHRAGALRQGQQPHVADADRAHRRRRAARRAGRPGSRRCGPRSAEHPQPLRLPALVGADRDRAGHADRSTTRSRPSPRRRRSAAAHVARGRATASPTRPGSPPPTRPYAGWRG